jgi:hypothetical protein
MHHKALLLYSESNIIDMKCFQNITRLEEYPESTERKERRETALRQRQVQAERNARALAVLHRLLSQVISRCPFTPADMYVASAMPP